MLEPKARAALVFNDVLDNGQDDERTLTLTPTSTPTRTRTRTLTLTLTPTLTPCQAVEHVDLVG